MMPTPWNSKVFLAALERFPPPEFTDHIVPETTVPGPRPAWFDTIDAVVLAGVLGLAAWLVHRRRSRRGVFLLMLAALGYFGFYRQGCICPVGSLQNVAMAVADSSYALPVAVAALFLLPLVFALFYGRVFCAAICPLGAIQDVVILKPLHLPAWLRAGLGVIPYLFLGTAVVLAALGGGFIICRYDPFVALFRLSGSAPMVILGGALLVVGLFVARPYCRFICPYAVLLRFLAKVSRWRISVTPDHCIRCRLCENACPFDVIRPPSRPVSAADRPAGKRRLALLIIFTPLLLGGGIAIGHKTGHVMALSHDTLHLAETLRLGTQPDPLPPGRRDALEAFHKSGTAEAAVLHEAASILADYRKGGAFLGGYFGLMTGLSLIGMSIRRHREGYEPDPADCLACGRCYAVCPRGKIKPPNP